MTSALLPDAGHALNGIVRRSIDRNPTLSAIISSGDECVPFSGEAYCLVVTSDISAKETDRGAARAAPHCFNLGGIQDTVGCAKVEAVRPSNRVIRVAMTGLNASVSLRRIAGGNRFIVDVGVINSAV